MKPRSRRTMLWGAVGFCLLGGYTVIHGYFQDPASLPIDRPGVWIGTFIGAGIVGAIIAALIGYASGSKS